jgi:predicted NAD/FAD-binding protein
MTQSLSLAVIGGGISGISAAYLLAHRHDVVLFEKEGRLGGHTNTVMVEDPEKGPQAIDTGFIVFNDRTYPVLEKLFDLWGVEARDSDMSFSFWCQRTGLMYNGTDIRGLFVQKRNAIRPSFLGMIRDILRFNKEALAFVEGEPGPGEAPAPGADPGISLGAWLKQGRYGRAFVEDYLVPMGAAIWSTGPGNMLVYPAKSILAFYRNHGLLSIHDRPQWKTVVGGSHSYLRAFEKKFRGRIVLGAGLRGVDRSGDRPVVILRDGTRQSYDGVVIATHADQALELLKDPDELESALLGAWRYNKNEAILHHDNRLLPPRRGAWASWNYVREAAPGSFRSPKRGWLSQEGDPTLERSVLSYHMNRLQGLETQRQYHVTLNPGRAPEAPRVLYRTMYEHPLFDGASVASRGRLQELQGRRGTYFAGAHFGHGFHEDGARSGVHVAKLLGCGLEDVAQWSR